MAAKIGCLLCVFIDYDYDYYGYGDYRGGYSDPYYDDYYRYEDYYFDYPPPPPPARGRGRQPQPVGRSTLLNVPSRLFVHSYICLFDCGTAFRSRTCPSSRPCSRTRQFSPNKAVLLYPVEHGHAKILDSSAQFYGNRRLGTSAFFCIITHLIIC